MSKVALVCGLLLFAACGSSTTCHDLGQGCAAASDCCEGGGGIICASGACALCGSKGALCTSENDCCAPMGCTVGGLCGECQEQGQACNTTDDCCGGPSLISSLVCDRFSKTCVPAKNLAVGQTCADTSQCQAGSYCSGFCTRACVANSNCLTGASYCSTIDSTCCPFCGNGSKTDCSTYGAGYSCQGVPTADGTTLPCCVP